VAGDPVPIAHPLLLRKRATLRGLSTAMDAPDVRRAAYLRLLDHVRAGRLTVDHELVEFQDIGAAWQRLADGAPRKLVVRIAQPR
jgi:NADPH-dependent curcumin reductase CurA